MSSYKVRISGPEGVIWLEASPNIGETRQASYDNYNIIHLPTDLYAYRHTSGRKFSLSAKLISRNVKEATANIGYINLARKWLLPNFGNGVGLAGATPPILKLYAYNNKNINGVNVVLKLYSWDFPEDVDYIYEASEPMPVIGSLRIELDEIYSAKQITAGDWQIKGGSNGRASDTGGSGNSSGGPGASESASPSSSGSGSGSRAGNALQNSLSSGGSSQNSSTLESEDYQNSSIMLNRFITGSINSFQSPGSTSITDENFGGNMDNSNTTEINGFQRFDNISNFSGAQDIS